MGGGGDEVKGPGLLACWGVLEDLKAGRKGEEAAGAAAAGLKTAGVLPWPADCNDPAGKSEADAPVGLPTAFFDLHTW